MLVRADNGSASSAERSWCRHVLAQIRPEPLLRHQKVRPAPSIHRARPALLGTSSGEIKDFAVFFDQRWGFGCSLSSTPLVCGRPNTAGAAFWFGCCGADLTRKRMVRRAHSAVLLLAVCLGGCGGYTMFDPESTGGLSYSGASATAPNPHPATGSTDGRDAATLNTMFASAAD